MSLLESIILKGKDLVLSNHFNLVIFKVLCTQIAGPTNFVLFFLSFSFNLKFKIVIFAFKKNIFRRQICFCNINYFIFISNQFCTVILLLNVLTFVNNIFTFLFFFIRLN